jgi:hypothetical protein
VFEPIPAARRDGHVGVQAEALEPGTPRGGRLGARSRAETPDGLPRARAEGHAALQRGGDRLREQRLLRRNRVAPRVVRRQPAAARQEAPDAAVQPREQGRDVRIGGRRQRVEDRARLGRRARVDAVEEERVEMNIGQEIAMKP